MRILLVVVLFLATHVVLAQRDSVGIRQAKNKDSMVAAIQTGVGISHMLADSAYSIISAYTLKIRAVVRSRIPKEQKDQQIRSLAAERDDKIQRLLSEDQITRLKALYSKNKPAAPAH